MHLFCNGQGYEPNGYQVCDIALLKIISLYIPYDTIQTKIDVKRCTEVGYHYSVKNVSRGGLYQHLIA